VSVRECVKRRRPRSPRRRHPNPRIDCAKGALRLIDISASTMADIGPAYGLLTRRDPALGERAGSIAADV
jgi:hypothetical protein